MPLEAVEDLRSLLMAGFVASLILWFLNAFDKPTHCPGCRGTHE